MSTWEIAIKSRLGKLAAPDDVPEWISASGLTALPVTNEHAWTIRQVDGLPHADPFDRLLVAQAQVEGIPLLTADHALLAATITPTIELVDARR